jgi:hypothetical protein
MEQQTIAKLISSFEECVYEQDGVEYWFARELQKLQKDIFPRITQLFGYSHPPCLPTKALRLLQLPDNM